MHCPNGRSIVVPIATLKLDQTRPLHPPDDASMMGWSIVKGEIQVKSRHVERSTGLVIEDAVSGLMSGRRAGALTLAVCTSTPRAVIDASGSSPDFIVSDLTKVTVDVVGGKIQVTMDQTS
ncbi:hypothetical protein M413DRAFT_7088 [Hebeloma cylindrosporum]|uniref:Uncharacterized protein n=1 Tax=Hebeloma cylindrosporum TaxID=76867 RepID=A0A0C3CV03_HEBCY|nr:hypothetical protein M413DRAFT_7088 [Hebeloma cylindrosporum h7]